MKKLIISILLTFFMGFLLTGCFFRPHKRDVIQGNIITPAETSQLHLGMTPAQVKAVMGPSVVENIFTSNRIEYVYTYQHAYQPMTETHLSCIFQNGHLVRMVTY